MEQNNTKSGATPFAQTYFHGTKADLKVGPQFRTIIPNKEQELERELELETRDLKPETRCLWLVANIEQYQFMSVLVICIARLYWV